MKLEKTIIYSYSFINSFNIIKNDKPLQRQKLKSNNRYEIYKNKSTIIKSVGTIGNTAERSMPVTKSVTRIGLIVLSQSNGVTCRLTIIIEVIDEIKEPKYGKH